MRATALLKTIEPLTYAARCRHLADLRRYAGEPELRDLLDELGERGHYERSLALFVAAAVRDEASLAHIARAMRDPAADLALAATDWAVRLGLPYEHFEEPLRDAPSALRAATYRAIRRWHRTDLAERLIDEIAERWGDQEAARLLIVCGEAAARARLDGLAHAVSSWKSLGRSHPGLMLDFAERRLSETPDALLAHWWERHGSGVAAAVPHAPERVIGLLERHCPAGVLPYPLHKRFGMLLDADTPRVLRLMLADRHRRGLTALLRHRRVRARLVPLGTPEAAEVARAVRDESRTLARLLRTFAPSRREEIFTAAMAGIDLATAEPAPAVMEVLPWRARAREARRMLGLRRVAERPRRVWEVTAYLPYDEALPVLREVARRPGADDRAIGYELLIGCAGRARDPEVLTRLLDDLGRLRNEQDPVRASAVTALASVPYSLLRPVHAPALAQITEDALNARDCSYSTRHQLTQLATRICRQGAVSDDAELLVFGLDTLAKLAGSTGSLGLPLIGRSLRRGQEHDLGRTLAPYLESAARRHDHRLAFALAGALQDRAYHVAEIQDALKAALDAPGDGDIRRAVDHWLAPPGTRAERVEHIVNKDPSTVALRTVFAVIARERTDLLDLALSGRTPKGRFRNPDVVYVPDPEVSWMRRWTSRQRGSYLALLHRLARDESAPDHTRARAAASIGEIPGVGAAELAPYLASDEPHLRRVALTAAVWGSSPQAVFPHLIELASSDDAHVAMYAASRAARYVAPSALPGALAPVLATGKITARKEALRILLRNRVPDAMAVVAAAWEEPRQHRDVRVAIASAVRDLLDDPRALQILNEAARGPRELALQVVRTVPVTIEDRHRAAYAALIVDIARSEDMEAVRAAIPMLSLWAPWAPGAPALLAGRLTDLDGTSTWRDALDALIRCARSGHGLAELATAAATLAAAVPAPDAGAERDRPAWQRLGELVRSVRHGHGSDPARSEPVVRALAGRLPEPLASELLAATVPWKAPGVETDLDALAARPIGGVFAVDRVARLLPVDHFGPAPERMLPHAVRLAARADLAPGLFACALTRDYGEEAGWPEEWRAVLRGLRAHPHPDVAYTAGSILTARE
ncbi:hypothetical protein [Actinomadura sp. 9N407]|uniref:hypothetical protein n=1 Tax=Actinomadura sp. 9N407 TaxID=3375154 RepID=UPI0037A5B93A